ncbi:hypothetical protein [Streptomyces sp. NPDC091209]|uniref:hypothetical protein n=1 Tax=Streptomyces sp. NPDC091209 TaxID=3365974 RepID=UPI0038064A3C
MSMVAGWLNTSGPRRRFGVLATVGPVPPGIPNCEFGRTGGSVALSRELQPFDECVDLAAEDWSDALLQLESQAAGQWAAGQVLRGEGFHVEKVHQDGCVVAAQGVAAGQLEDVGELAFSAGQLGGVDLVGQAESFLRRHRPASRC